MSPFRTQPSRIALALFATFVLALALRLLGAEQVFDGADVIFRGYDSYYHVRRALYSLVHFPGVLERDPYLNYPYGSAVPWPPLYDVFIAAVAKLLRGGELTLQRVAAFAPPLWGALGVIPAYAIGRTLGGASAGLVAAALVAGLDGHVAFSRVGAADHHAIAGLLGLLLLAAVLRLATRAEPAAGARAWLWLCALRVALVLSIPGSVMPLAACEGGLLVASSSMEHQAVQITASSRRRFIEFLLVGTGILSNGRRDRGMPPNGSRGGR